MLQTLLENIVVTVTDNVGNTYRQAALAVNWANGRAYIFYAFAQNPLPSSSTITITGDQSVAAKAAVVSTFSGLTEDALDKFLGIRFLIGGSSCSIRYFGNCWSNGNDCPSQQTCYRCNWYGRRTGQDAAGTWGNSFNTGPRVGTTGGTATDNWTVSLGWRLVLRQVSIQRQKAVLHRVIQLSDYCYF